jgi:DNA-binding IclR family transcriptional regulator
MSLQDTVHVASWFGGDPLEAFPTGRLEMPCGVLEKAIIILGSIGASQGPICLSELCRRTGLAKSTACRILATLNAYALVVRDGNHYVIGDRFLGLTTASRWTARRRIGKRLMPYLIGLHQATGHTVSLGLLAGTEVLYQERIYGHDSIRTPSYDSDRAPAHCTAIGKVLLAHDQPWAATYLCGRNLPRLTRMTIVDPMEFQCELLAIRRQGIAHSCEEYAPNIACVAAPVYGHNRVPVAAVAVTTDAADIGDRKLDGRIRRVVANCAALLRGRPACSLRQGA